MTSTRTSTPASLVLTLVTAQFVVMLDSSIINVALPSIARDLGLAVVDTAWVLNAYFLTFGALLLISGRAADVFGRRRMFLAGTAVLLGGSLLGGVAPTSAVLMVARLVQGAGAAMLSPAAMSVVLDRFEGPARTRAMSAWGAASTVGGAAGVSVGGLLSATFGWQSVMFVTAAAAAVVGLAGRRLVPIDAKGMRRRFDATGAALLTTSAVAVVFAILQLPQSGFASLQVLGALVLAVVAVVVFVVVERGSVDPVLPIAALRDARVAGGMVVNLLGGATRIACFFLVALLLQQVLDYGPGTAGLAMLPTSLAGFAVSTLVLPRALDRLGPQRVVLIGLLLLVVAHLLLSGVGRGDVYARPCASRPPDRGRGSVAELHPDDAGDRRGHGGEQRRGEFRNRLRNRSDRRGDRDCGLRGARRCRPRAGAGCWRLVFGCRARRDQHRPVRCRSHRWPGGHRGARGVSDAPSPCDRFACAPSGGASVRLSSHGRSSLRAVPAVARRIRPECR